MVRIAISGSVGSGKTTLAKEIGKKLNFNVIHLNEVAEKYKIEDIKELQTFDFDLDQLLDDFESQLKQGNYDNCIIESHFSQYVDPVFIDVLIIINRNLKELKLEYQQRGYNKQKIQDNLEVESFNLCFYEAEEQGYQVGTGGVPGMIQKDDHKVQKKGIVFSIDNSKSMDDLVEKVIRKFEKIDILGGKQ